MSESVAIREMSMPFYAGVTDTTPRRAVRGAGPITIVDICTSDQHVIEIRQGDVVVAVVDCFVDDLIAALQRARGHA